MKFLGLKAFGLVGFLALAVSCSSTTGSSNEDYEASSSSARPSSSAIASSSSSSKAIVPDADTSLVDTSLAAPTGLSATEIDGSWILSWEYPDDAKNSVKAFVVQVLDLESEDAPAWKDLAQTIHDVYRYRIGKQTSTYLYYRVAALDESGARSQYSEEVLVQVEKADVVDGSSSSAVSVLSAPTNLSVTEVNGSRLLAWDYDNNKKNPVDSFVVYVLDMEVEGTPAWKSLATVSPDVYRYRVEEIPSKYLFYRVAARNSAGDLSDYSNEVMIQIVDEEVVEGSSSSGASSVASPTGLSATQIGENWILSWNYEDEKTNPAVKFVVQVLDLENASDWKDESDLPLSVQLYQLENLRYAYFYYRVAAENAAGERSYSDKVLVNLTQTAVTAPVIEGTEILSKKKTLLLNWSFSTSTVFPAKGFVVEQLDLATNSWNSLGSVDASTQRYEIGVAHEDRFFRVRAYTANEDTVSSSTYTVSAETLSSPSGFSALRIAPSVWQLTWEYSRNLLREETGFLVQSSPDENSQWTDVGTSPTEILYYYVSGNDNLEKHFRVAAYDEDDTTGFSYSLQLVANTDEIAYRNDMKPTTPTVSVSPILQKTTGFVNGDSVETDIIDTLDYVLSISSGFTNKNILSSEYTKSVHYEVRWYTESTGSSVTETIEVDRLATKYSNIEGHLEIPTLERGTKENPGNGYRCDDFQNLYGQLRIVWTDVNDVTDYSEWTNPQKAGRVCGE